VELDERMLQASYLAWNQAGFGQENNNFEVIISIKKWIQITSSISFVNPALGNNLGNNLKCTFCSINL